ncbi:hypothetical protein FBUS_01299 [Fasciolopsis buskii]|uniref:Uncharacterized protein n=1 Tax=Fasciolopsis buskii TaxID=27845 RepID=A0A8E0VMX9_9TREM|nr:hypothetical protein FBUS_01299 [Fasciolopsis buski]
MYKIRSSYTIYPFFLSFHPPSQTEKQRTHLREHRSKPAQIALKATRPSTSAGGFVGNKTTETKCVRDLDIEVGMVVSDESQTRGERRPAKPNSTRGSIRSSSRERSKLWDIYSKVAVIPIDASSTPPKFSCGTHHSNKATMAPAERDAKIVIIPRLAASPKRRKPTMDSTSLSLIDSNTAQYPPKHSRKNAFMNGERYPNSPKERIKYFTPTGSRVSVRQADSGISIKESVRLPSKVRVQDQLESPHNYGISKQEQPVLQSCHNSHHNDRPTEPKRQKRDHGNDQMIPEEPKATTSMRDQREKQSESKKHRELRFEKTEPHLERVPRLTYASVPTTDDFNSSDTKNASRISATQTLVEKESVL